MNDLLLSKLEQFYDLNEFSTFLKGIHEISDLFACLDRPNIDSARLIRVKYAMMHWRLYCKKKILVEYPCGDEEGAISALIRLSIYLSRKDCKSLISKSTPDKVLPLFVYAGYADVYQKIGGKICTHCGPQASMSMVANRQLRLCPNGWLGKEEFSDYCFNGSDVLYRGLRFKEGDIILSAVNLGGNGSFTAITEPRNYAFHSGFFVYYPYKGKLVPSVIETYEIGVRPVPLSHFISPIFSCYVEVYRHEELDDEKRKGLGSIAFDLAKNTKGYNFDTEDSDRTYLACTTLGNEIFKRAGISEISSKSKVVDPIIQKNIKAFGLVRNDFMFPLDFMIDPKVSFVGTVDNDMFAKSVTQELSDRIFNKAFSRNEIDFKNMPFYFHFIHYFMGHLRRGTFVGKILGIAKGFNAVTLPKGNNLAITMIDTCAQYVAYWERKLQKFLKKELKSDKYFNIDSFCHHYAGHKKVKKIYSALQNWFS